ncbi:hypothetical protein ACFRI7_20175 [Streptomyces sp. NPDC056716]|uniref:hypothetical protein n=1 Tax=unclassified Streptomyces TaxID=2593676 RepID=UPI0036CDA21C
MSHGLQAVLGPRPGARRSCLASVLATELAIKYHSPVAWTTSDRALTAARASGDPQVTAAVARMTALTMRRAGRGADAAQFLARTALAHAESHRGDSPPAVLDAATVLLLTARTPDEGITYARRIDPARLPTAGRTARFLTDSGRMWHRIGNGPAPAPPCEPSSEQRRRNCGAPRCGP